MIYWYILKLIDNTQITFGEFLSISGSLNCIENSKINIWKGLVKYLGHKISNSIVLIDPAKTEAISIWPEPSCVYELQ